ncbi:HNH endonuclease signature motif containing protein [Nocardioides mesophilus]|uniref:DUF222 domain-containing protein n=1 Tax=Nocardioides mesophilus TaxID=433659 RepID=A0A7G9RFX7_9ACTN|nr:HNH endonuclease signature motif containing protein [Nocardioides mesophilus]QNN54502.1 DUF222 domain-containing protein [Nocardioides mesophilus]
MAADLEDVRAWVGTLADLGGGLGDAERVDLIRALEELKGAAAAAQARVSCDFDVSQREAQRAAGVPERRVGQGVAAQVALARRDSPHRGDQHLGTAKALVREMPHTLGLLTRGVLSERRATLLVRETAYLAREHRAVIDAELAGPGAVEAVAELSDRALVAAAQRIAYRLDPHAVTDRARRAASQRSVTLRPAPDTMSYLTGLLPVAQGVACYAVLTRAADTARAAGDPRTRGQVMADTLVAALGAQANPAPDADADAGAASDPAPAPAPTSPTSDPAGPAGSISLQLVMTDRTLLRGDDEPAHLVGYGTVPAGWARDLLRSTGAEVFLRRIYTSPGSGRLLAADAKARRFTGALREVLIARDQRCRTPWCDAPVRHLDHARPWESGGTTSTVNGQGQCEKCNYAKQAPGWTADGTAPPGDRHSVHTTTPTGHRYRSRAPAPPGTPAPTPRPSRAELHLSDIVLAS